VTPGLVSLTVTVTNDKGELVSGLKQEHFSVFVDKVPAKIHYFGDQDVPVSVGILFDVSASITDSKNSKKLKVLGEALSNFLARANNSNDYFVAGFNDKPQLLLDWTSDPKAILDPFSILQPKGRTALYDAIAVGVGKVLQGRHRKRAILLISDGLDNVSRYKFKEIQKLLKESNVLVYSIYAGNAEPGSALGFEGLVVLDKLSAASGGIVLNPKSRAAAVSAVFERIAQELQHQYTIGIAQTALKARPSGMVSK